MGLFNWYQTLLVTRPVITKATTGFCIGFSSDFVSQYIECSLENYNFRSRFIFQRSLNMGLFTFSISPAFHYWFKFLAHRFPGTTWKPFLKKFLLDRLLVPPPLVLSFFVSQTLMNGGSLKDLENRVNGHYLNALKMNLMVWPAAMLINFRFVPLHFQVLYSNFIGFNWTIYLSWAIHKHKIVYDENICINMFKEIIDEYADRRLELKLRINDSKCKLAVSSAELNENISNSLNGQVLVLHENQKKIDLQCKVLRNEAEKLALHNQNWLKMYSKLNHSLKQVGDLNNWAFMLEKEMAEVSAAITKLVSK